MITSLLLALTLGQYTRTTANSDPLKCLWWNEQTTITWTQQADGNPETTGDTEFTAFEKAFGTWQEQLEACGSLRFSQAPRTQTRTIGWLERGPNENVMVFRKTGCTETVPANDSCWKDQDCGSRYDCWEFSMNTIAITTTSYSPTTARILDADMELNAWQFIFTTVDSPACVSGAWSQSCVAADVQNTITHEVGHLLGLGHSSTLGSTMAARADSGETSKRVLDPGSKQFICDVYPKGLPAKSCVTAAVENPLQLQAAGCAAAAHANSAPSALTLTVMALMTIRRRRRGGSGSVVG